MLQPSFFGASKSILCQLKASKTHNTGQKNYQFTLQPENFISTAKKLQALPYKRTGRPFAKAFLKHLNHGIMPRFFSICQITSQYIILLTKKFKFHKVLMQILARHSFWRVKIPTSPFTHEWTSSSNYSSAFLPSVSAKK